MSSLEHQKNTGQLDLSTIKRKKNVRVPPIRVKQTMDKELSYLAKLTAPENMGPLISQRKAPSKITLRPLDYGHATSMETIGAKKSTQDNTTLADPSQAAIRRDIDEDSILRDYVNMNVRRLPPASQMTSPKIQKTIERQDEMGSADFEMSASLSPGKLDRHLERILNEQNKIGQD